MRWTKRIRIWAVAGVMAAQTAGALPAATPASDYAAIPFVSSAKISPDGQWIAGIFGVNGQRQVCMISLFLTPVKQVCNPVPDLVDVFGVEWVGDHNIIAHSRQLLVMGDSLATGPSFSVGRLIATNRETGKMTPLLGGKGGQYTDSVLWRARDGSPEILLGAQYGMSDMTDVWPRVFRVNVENGEHKLVSEARHEVMEWLVDGQGRLRAGYSKSTERLAYGLLYRGERGGEFDKIAHLDKNERTPIPVIEAFVPGGDHVLAVHRDGEGISGLYEIDIRTREDIKRLYAAPKGSWIADTIVADDKASVIGVELEGEAAGRVWLDPVLAEVQGDLDKAMAGKRVTILSLNATREQMLVKVDRPDSPGALYYYNIPDGRLMRIAYYNEALKTEPQNPARLVHYKARDGLEIEAVLTLPKGREAKGLPVVVMPHGGPWAQDTLDFDYWAQFVASLGYAVIQPNFRGSTGYGYDFEHKGDGQMGLAMQDDLNDALAWLGAEGIGDVKRACIMGGSYGGYATMWGLARDAGLWRCGISIAGVANIRREVNDMGEGNIYGRINSARWATMTPDFAAVSPINAVGRITAPLLLLHGGRDITVKYEQSVEMYGRMKAAKKPVELISLPHADHHFSRAADRLELLQRIEGFLRQHNPPDAQIASGAKEKGQ